MNNTKTSAVSGFVIWFLSICIISSCVMPVFFVVGSVSSFSNFAIKTLAVGYALKGQRLKVILIQRPPMMRTASNNLQLLMNCIV